MAIYIRRRLSGFIVVLIGVSILSFTLIVLSKTDPAEAIALRNAGYVSEELVNRIREDLNLNGSVAARYFKWIGGLLTGNLGVSIYSYNPVAQDLKVYFPATLALVGLSMLWIVLISVPVGLVCTRWKNGIFDQAARGVTILSICLPTFWLGFILLLAFAVKLPLFSVVPEPGIKGLLLPSLTLAVPVSGSTIRLFRASLLGEMNRDYVIYASARGLSPWRIITRHAMRNALPPIVTLFCQYLGYLIAGSAVVERVFSLKGIGSYLIACIMAVDITTVATCMVIISGVFVLANLAGDIINRKLCPWMLREYNA